MRDKTAVCEALLYEAVTFAVWFEPNVAAVAVNVAVVLPAPIMRNAGTESAGLSLDRRMLAPIAGAAADSVRVQVVLPPLIRLAGEQDKRLGTGSGIDGTVGAGTGGGAG